MDEKFFNNFNKAMKLSELLKNNNSDEGMDIGMMMELMTSFSSFDDNESQPLDRNYIAPTSPLENEINDPGINGIKACIPYLEYKYQKNIAIFIKLIEMERMMDIFKAKTRDVSNPVENNIGMLLAVKPHLRKEHQSHIDKALNLMSMIEAMQSFSKLNKKGENNNGS